MDWPLWYLNFVQIPTVPTIQPVEHRTAISKFILPNVLFWFRYGALATVVTGLMLAYMNGYLVEALTLGRSTIAIGIGMWLATIMWFNVWFIIWPNQQKALNINNQYPDLAADVKAASAKTAMLFSRTNTFLSVPMLVAMTGASTLF